MKILVTGNAGSGKSSFGKKLSKELDIPLYGLDKVVWEENWTKTPKEKREKLIQEITNNESWIIEGVSKQVLQKADKVIFLDIPTRKCVTNIIKRFAKYGFKTRPELPENCPEYIGIFKAIRIALIFKNVTKPWLMHEVNSGKMVRVTDYSELSTHIV